MPDVDHAARVAEAVSAEVVADAVAAVKSHPEYQRAIESLSAAALNTLLSAIGVGI